MEGKDRLSDYPFLWVERREPGALLTYALSERLHLTGCPRRYDASAWKLLSHSESGSVTDRSGKLPDHRLVLDHLVLSVALSPSQASPATRSSSSAVWMTFRLSCPLAAAVAAGLDAVVRHDSNPHPNAGEVQMKWHRKVAARYQ